MVLRTCCLLSTLIMVPLAQGASYYRCTDDKGHTTFSQVPCGPDAEKGLVQTRPGPRSQRSAQQQLRRMEAIRGDSKRPAGGRKPLDRCAKVSSIALRNARVGRQIMACHSEADILSMLGEPDSRSAWSSGATRGKRWRYYWDDGRRVSVDFENGVVRRWRWTGLRKDR